MTINDLLTQFDDLASTIEAELGRKKKAIQRKKKEL